MLHFIKLQMLPRMFSGRVKVATSALLVGLMCSATLVRGAHYPIIWDRGTTSSRGFKAPVELTDGALLTVITRHTTAGAEQLCFRSNDQAGSWALAGVVAADPDKTTDLGDAMIMQLRSGDVLCSYRHNHHATTDTATHSYSIRVAKSSDGGRTWAPHSTVAECTATTYGLWSSFLLERQTGELQCYYDDEDTPSHHDLPRHQWLTMKTWNGASGAWEDPVTVSRAHNPKHLSRDGMPCVVELTDGRLLCVFESVRVTKPWKGCVRRVTSCDGGRNWSWQEVERPFVYAPCDDEYNSLAPWTIRLGSGELVCVFVTDEDRDKPDTPATAILDENVKAVYSHTDGRTWSCYPQTVSKIHPAYAPGIIELKQSEGGNGILIQYCAPFRTVTQRGLLAY